MSSHSLNHTTLVNSLWEDKSILRNLLLVVAGSVLLIVSAKIKIPFYPVPLSMQTFVVLMIGMVYGWKLGAATVLLYLIEGAFGLPVFSGTPERGIGIAYMVGPTGGYLLGFLFAAALAGWLAERGWGHNFLSTFGAMVLGNLIIYSLGLLWLGTVIGWDKPVLAYGLTPFVLGDLLKIVAATLLLPLAWEKFKTD
jgi:biotin transport system substrate-specific component